MTILVTGASGLVGRQVVALLRKDGIVVRGATRRPQGPVAVAGAAACFVLRLLAIRHGWQLPVARSRK